MHHFRKISIEDQVLFDDYVSKLPFYDRYVSSELVFLNLIAWSKDECIEIMWKDEIGYIRCLKHNLIWFFPPIASSTEGFLKGIKHIKTYYPQSRVIGITEAMKNLLDFDDFLCLVDDKLAEYIYDPKAFIEMKGQAYHRKRNLIAQFKKKYPYTFERYQNDMKNDVSDFINRYKEQGGAVDDLDAFYKTVSLLEKGLDYQFYVLKVDEKVVGLSISIITKNNIGIILFEKADTHYIGSYQMLAYLMALTVLSDARYINRQEDVGLPELRRAKLSNNPIRKDPKYALQWSPLMKKAYALYEVSFPEDSKAYRDYFFLHHYNEMNMRYILEDGIMKASLHLKMNDFQFIDKTLMIPLILGAATDPSYRKQGYMTRLLSQYIEECKEKKIPWIILSTELPQVYEQVGFVAVGHIEKVGSYPKLENCILEQTANMTLLSNLYESHFGGSNHDVRDVSYYQDLVYGLAMDGYETYLIKHDNKTIGYVIQNEENVEEMVLFEKVHPIIENHDYTHVLVPSDIGSPSHMIAITNKDEFIKLLLLCQVIQDDDLRYISSLNEKELIDLVFNNKADESSKNRIIHIPSTWMNKY